MLQLRTKSQVQGLADLLLDVIKIIIGAVIIGFFIPSSGVPFEFFIVGIVLIIMSFWFSMKLLGSIKA